MVIPCAKAQAPRARSRSSPHRLVDGQAGAFLGAGHQLLPVGLALGALSIVDALENDDLLREAPAIVTSQSPSALAHA